MRRSYLTGRGMNARRIRRERRQNRELFRRDMPFISFTNDSGWMLREHGVYQSWAGGVDGGFTQITDIDRAANRAYFIRLP